jgi:hypothetical protein
MQQQQSSEESSGGDVTVFGLYGLADTRRRDRKKRRGTITNQKLRVQNRRGGKEKEQQKKETRVKK